MRLVWAFASCGLVAAIVVFLPAPSESGATAVFTAAQEEQAVSTPLSTQGAQFSVEQAGRRGFDKVSSMALTATSENAQSSQRDINFQDPSALPAYKSTSLNNSSGRLPNIDDPGFEYVRGDGYTSNTGYINVDPSEPEATFSALDGRTVDRSTYPISDDPFSSSSGTSTEQRPTANVTSDSPET